MDRAIKEVGIMKLDILKPDERLQDYIKYYWVLDFNAPGYIQKVIPSGETQMLFHYKEPFRQLEAGHEPDMNKSSTQPVSLICGQVTGQKNILASSSTGVVGVVFFPHAPRLFFRVNMHELTDLSVEASLVDQAAGLLEQQVIEAADTKKRIGLIEHYFLKKLGRREIKHFDIIKHSVLKIKALKGQLTVSGILEDIGLTQRHYERLFSSSVGVSCKKFIEITRFGHAVSLMDSNLSLSAIAYETGYYDQSHFIRCFKKYMGTSPRMYRSGKFA